MEDKVISQEESLEIITRMIKTARGSIKGASFYFLFWGWIVVFGNIGQYLLQELTSYEHPYIVWLIAIPGAIISYWRGSRMSARSKVRTYSGSLVYHVWIGYLPCLLISIFFGSYFNFQITALIMLFTGMATYISGAALNFAPLKLGSVLFWVLAPVALIVGHEYSPIVMTLGIIGGYLIPGYILKNTK